MKEILKSQLEKTRISMNVNNMNEHEQLLAHHPLPVDEPVGGDVGVALHAPGQVELVTVEPIPQASHHRLIGPT